MNAIETQFLNCVGYWNNNIKEINDLNKPLKEVLVSEINSFINGDLFSNEGNDYEVGTGGSHIWVHRNNERIIMLTF